MTHKELIERITVDRNVCGGKPVIKGTRLPISVILGGLFEGLSPEQIVDHFPHISVEDVRAAAAYAAELADENSWKFAV